MLGNKKELNNSRIIKKVTVGIRGSSGKFANKGLKEIIPW
jgi:hypothetical protein